MPLSKFPRPGFPIVPALFAPYLNRAVRGYGRLGALDTSIWSRFDERTCRWLAEVVVDEVTQLLKRKKLNLRRLSIPATKRRLSLEDLELQFRTKSRLQECGIVQFPEQLVGMTIGQLLDIPSFGVTSVVDFLTSLQHLGEMSSNQSILVSNRVLPRNLREVVSRQGCLPPKLLDHLLPQVSSLIQLSDLPLQVRTSNALRLARLLNQPAALFRLRAGQILRIRGIGITSLVDLVECLYAAGAQVTATPIDGPGDSLTTPVSRRLPQNIRTIVSEKRGLPPAFLDYFLPQPPSELALPNLPLHVRTFNSLSNANYANRIAELCQTRIEEVMKIRGFGITSLIDLVEGLYAVGAINVGRTEADAESPELSASHSEHRVADDRPVVPRNLRAIVETEGLLPMPIQRSRMPDHLRNVRLMKIGLSPRTVSMLKRAGLLDQPQNLAEMSVVEVFRLPGCNVEKLIDIVECAYRCVDQKQFDFSSASSRESVSRTATDLTCATSVSSHPLSSQQHLEQLANEGHFAWPSHASIETGNQRLVPRVVSKDIRKQIRHGKVPPGLRQSTLPALPSGYAIADLQLPWRVFHSLSKSGLADDPAKLSSTTIARLLEFEGIGPDGVCNIVEACYRCCDQSKQSGASNCESMDGLVVRRLVPSGAKRDSEIVSEFLGLFGKKIKTLEQVGHQFGVTRERVRQICQRHADELQSLATMPISTALIARMNSLVPCTVKTAEKALCEAKLTETGTSIEAVLKVLQLSGMPSEFVVVMVHRTRVFLANRHRSCFDQIQKSMAKLTRWNGCCSRHALLESGSGRESNLDRRRLVSLALRSTKGFEWLDEDRQWFWFSTARKLHRRILRILAVAGRIPLTELRSALRRDLRLRHSMPPVSALQKVCRQLPDCTTDGDTVWSTRPIEPAEVIRGYELEIVHLLIEHGPVIGRKRLQEIATTSGIGMPSLWRVLSFSPTIMRYATGVYGLVGANVSPSLIRSIQESEPKTEGGRQDHGWTLDGKVWLAYRLSDGAADTGVISMPSALSAILNGNYSLRAEGLAHVGKLTVKGSTAWGLSPLFRRLSAEASDTILLTICPKTRSANLKVGDESLLDEIKSPD